MVDLAIVVKDFCDDPVSSPAHREAAEEQKRVVNKTKTCAREWGAGEGGGPSGVTHWEKIDALVYGILASDDDVVSALDPDQLLEPRLHRAKDLTSDTAMVAGSQL